MHEILIGPNLKIDRAFDLLTELKSVEQDFWRNCSPRIAIKEDLQAGTRHGVILSDAKVDPMVHVLTGEIIYHLRSSLDQIAVGFAKISLRKIKLKEIYFPSSDGEKAFENDNSKTVGIDPDLVKFLKRQNAYNGGNQLLWSIFKLANIDKHMELIPFQSHSNVFNLPSLSVRNANVGLILGNGGDIHKGIVISDLGPNGVIEITDPEAEIKAGGHIVFSNTTVCNGDKIGVTLHRQTVIVRRIIQEAQALLNARESRSYAFKAPFGSKPSE